MFALEKKKTLSKKFKKFLYSFLFCSIFPTVAYADGGIPIIFLLNSYAFIAGSIWVIFSEYGYLRLAVKVPDVPIFKTVLIANIVTSIIGIVIIPIAFIMTGLEPLLYWLGDGRPMPFPLPMFFVIDFAISFVMTVAVEYLVMVKMFTHCQIRKKRIFEYSIVMNLISYAGLTLLVQVTINLMSHHKMF